MKRFVLAVALALGTLLVPVAEATAASVTINENGVTVHDGLGDGYRNHRRHYRDSYRYNRRHGYRERCRVRTVKTYRHNRLIIRKERVCR